MAGNINFIKIFFNTKICYGIKSSHFFQVANTETINTGLGRSITQMEMYAPFVCVEGFAKVGIGAPNQMQMLKVSVNFDLLCCYPWYKITTSFPCLSEKYYPKGMFSISMEQTFPQKNRGGVHSKLRSSWAW